MSMKVKNGFTDHIILQVLIHKKRKGNTISLNYFQIIRNL